MSTDANINRLLPKASLLRWEIGIALLLKVILLTGLWFLIFKWEGKPTTQPDIATRFELPATQSSIAPTFSPQPLKESRHVR